MINYLLFQRFKKVIHFLTGNDLTEHSFVLLCDRLKPFCSEEKIPDLESLLKRLELPYETSLRSKFVTIATIHETMFFRDERCFTAFREFVKSNLLVWKKRPLCLWSAGCSLGAEVVSMLITCAEAGLAPHQVQLYATDISEDCVKATGAGVFTSAQIQRGVVPSIRDKYFKSKDEKTWEFDPNWRSTIRASRVDLMNAASFPLRMDVIFCRYVLI